LRTTLYLNIDFIGEGLVLRRRFTEQESDPRSEGSAFDAPPIALRPPAGRGVAHESTQVPWIHLGRGRRRRYRFSISWARIQPSGPGAPNQKGIDHNRALQGDEQPLLSGNNHERKISRGPITQGGLEIWPRGIYDLVMDISHRYSNPIIEITESGCGYLDGPLESAGGRVPDARRIAFFRDELAELAHAIADGAKVRAFHAWSLLDNFEWIDGYTQRYGLTYVDFRDQKRTVKDSGLWCAQVAATNRLA
jgi:beta-glucosidase/6-phospho-beta-glucosidase/beta-galactosidase